MKRPNILLITADEMRYDCMGCAGHPHVRTPNIDRIAARGTRFTNAYTPFTVCAPARYSLMSGMYAFAHGATGNKAYLPEQQPTLPGQLQAAGYRTAAMGKMHFWPVYRSLGFERMRLAEQNGPGWKIDDYHSEYLAAKGLVDQWDLWDQQMPYRDQAPPEYWKTFGARASELAEEDYHTTWITDETIRYIEEDDDRPFFIWTSYIKPHHPFDPPRPWDEMYNPAELDPLDDPLCLEKPLFTAGGRDPRIGFFDLRHLTDEKYRQVAALYYATISHIDHHVGRLLDTLATRGELDNTIVIFTSDHGDYMGHYGLIIKVPNLPYDSLGKIPLVMAGPGIREGQASDALVSLIDLMPTTLPLCGVETPSCVQGADLAAVLSGQRPGVRDVIFFESTEAKAVRTERYKYLYNRRYEIHELYDVLEDPLERVNLAERPEMQGVIREMRDHLLGWLIDSQWHRYVVREPGFQRVDVP